MIYNKRNLTWLKKKDDNQPIHIIYNTKGKRKTVIYVYII